MDGADPFSWYNTLPLVSRCYLTGAVATSAACFFEFVSPLTLYYNYDLIFHRGHYWRIFSSFLFFGPFSLDFLFHMYFVIRYCRLLEDGKFRDRPADLIFMIIFGIASMLTLCACFETFSRIKFLGHSLSFMMVYVWARGRENEHVRLSLLGLYDFNAPYLPWVLFLFSLFLGNPASTDLLGIVVGHVYFFFDQVYPRVANLRQWPLKKIMVTPFILEYLISGTSNRGNNARLHVHRMEGGGGGGIAIGVADFDDDNQNNVQNDRVNNENHGNNPENNEHHHPHQD